MIKIDNNNLTEHVGSIVEIYCQVGVCFSLTGTLLNGSGLCRWGVRLSTGHEIGFRFGHFNILPNKTVSITII
jgi:hypothetical protein